jgi:aromatic ring-cleaving dioxygenase
MRLARSSAGRARSCKREKRLLASGAQEDRAVTIADDAPCHAHIYFSPEEREAAERLRDSFLRRMEDADGILFVGRMTEGKAGPHPIPQYEVHFHGRWVGSVTAAIERSGLRALVHPLTDDDMADHTSLGHWIGEEIALDLGTLDPPGMNQGIARFGKSDF